MSHRRISHWRGSVRGLYKRGAGVSARSANGMVPAVLLPRQRRIWQGAPKTKEHAMSQNFNSAVAVIGIDIGKNSFHVVGLDDRGAIVLRQKWSRGLIEARLANLPPC